MDDSKVARIDLRSRQFETQTLSSSKRLLLKSSRLELLAKAFRLRKTIRSASSFAYNRVLLQERLSVRKSS